MEWYYNVKKRRRILRIAITVSLLTGLFISTRYFYSSFQNNIKSESNADSLEDAKETEKAKLLPIPTAAVAVLKEPDTTAMRTSEPVSGEKAEAELQQTPVITPLPGDLIEKPPQKLTSRLAEASAGTPTPDTESNKPPATIQKQSSPKATTPSPQKNMQPPVVKTDNGEAKAESIILQYRNEEAGENTKIIYPVIRIVNRGKETINLSDIAIRYYYTKEGSEKETYWYDWFTKFQTSVYGNFSRLSAAKDNADHFLELRFESSKDTLMPDESAEIKIGFAKNDWTEYNQFNDYSFNPSKSYIDWDHITLYVSGRLVYGKEP